MKNCYVPSELIPTRKSLVTRLKNWDDQASWKTFFDTYWRLIYSVARRAGLNDAEAQDVVQETIISVAKKMPDFKYDPALGSFKGWLMQATHWRIQDHCRKKQYQKGSQRMPREERLQTSLLEDQPESAPFDLERAWDEEWTRNLTEAALERVRENVSPRHYQIFYLHLCKQMSARQVAKSLDVKLAEVYYAKYVVSREFRKEIESLERQIL